MDKTMFEQPTVEIILFSTEDVIATSDPVELPIQPWALDS